MKYLGVSLDPRSLALYRIGLGVAILVDLVLRWPFLKAFYSDSGIWPRAASVPGPSNLWHLLPHFWSGEPLWQQVLVLLTAALAMAFALGYHTRWVNLLLWIALLSLHARNGYVANAGSTLSLILLFWSLFLLPPGERPSQRFAGLALALQVGLLYWSAAILKLTPEWWPEGSALHYALHLESYVTSLGRSLREFETATRALTYATWVWEATGPLLFFAFKGLRRSFVALGFILMHLGMALTLELGVFPWVCIMVWIALLPREFWEKLKVPSAALINKSSGPTGRHERLMASGVVLTFLLSLTANGFSLLGQRAPQPLHFVLSLLHFHQRWDMFHILPRRNTFYVAEAKTQNGEVLDLIQHLPPSVHWRKYFTFVRRRPALRPHLNHYLCQQWNDHAPFELKVTEIELFQVSQPIPAPQHLRSGGPQSSFRRQRIAESTCP